MRECFRASENGSETPPTESVSAVRGASCQGAHQGLPHDGIIADVNGVIFLAALVTGILTGLIVWMALNSRHAAITEKLRACDEENGRISADFAEVRRRLETVQQEKARVEQDLAAVRADSSARLAAEQQRVIEQERRSAQYLADVEKMRTTLQTEFQAVAARLLDEKSVKFTEHNKTQIDGLLTPLRQQLSDFRTRIDAVYKTESDDRVSLKTQIEQLRQLNVRITDEAHALTQALKGQSQVRGAWGELVLERLLTAAGLQKGQDYLVQETLTTDDGRRLRPDVILRLPDQRHLVIDSKLSLLAYERWVNTTDESQLAALATEHVRAVRAHVEDLAGKSYHETDRLITPDYVLMFVPLEPAFSAAVESDRALYEWALEKRVVLCTVPTLLVTLKTVALLWKQDRQTRNVQEIARRGGLLYDKFTGLFSDLEAVGQHLSRARESYDEVLAKLKTGRGNLLSQVEDLKTLGAKAQKSLPAASTNPET
jgi:DNA recombination protein RmuC